MSQLTHTPKATVNRWLPLVYSGIMIFLLLMVLCLYTLLHEGGHALLGLLFGGKITSFSANFLNLSAHVGIDGEFTLWQNALISAAGVSLPVLLCMLYMLLSPGTREPVLAWFKLLLFLGSINSLLAWVAIPVLVLFGKTASDDSFNFLNYTKLPPLLVTAVAVLIYLGCWVLFVRRMGGFQTLKTQFRGEGLDWQSPETQRNLGSLFAVGVIFMAGTFALTVAMQDRGFQPPADYQQIADIPLKDSRWDDGVLYRFSLEKPSSVNFFFGLNNVKGGPAKIHLIGPDGYDEVFFHDNRPDLDIGRASSHPRNILLKPGDYEIRVTFQPSKGSVLFALKFE